MLLVTGSVEHSRQMLRRKSSMFDDSTSYAALLKERLKEVSHNIVGAEPVLPEDDTYDEVVKSDSVTLKSSIVKLKYANTYRMESYKKFQVHLVQARAEQILKDRVTKFNYDPEIYSPMSVSLASEILAAVKEMGFDRYKYIVRVLIVENKGQGLNMSSRWLWNVEKDNWASAVLKTPSLISLAVIFAVYFD
ncbi:dynein light chain Tctex-type protein 2 isoform X2 [Lissotriton helveticus]